MVARFGERAARLEVGAIATACAGLTFVVLIASDSTAAQVGFLQLRAPFTATMFTITFPLAVLGARAVGIGVGAVAALLNIAWALSVLVGPLVAGGLAQTAGSQASYAIVMVAAAATVVWMTTTARQVRERPAASPPPGGDDRHRGLCNRAVHAYSGRVGLRAGTGKPLADVAQLAEAGPTRPERGVRDLSSASLPTASARSTYRTAARRPFDSPS